MDPFPSVGTCAKAIISYLTNNYSLGPAQTFPKGLWLDMKVSGVYFTPYLVVRSHLCGLPLAIYDGTLVGTIVR